MADFSRTRVPVDTLLTFIRSQLATITAVDVNVQTFYGGNENELFNYNIIKPTVKPVVVVSYPRCTRKMEPQTIYEFYVYIVTSTPANRATAFTANQSVIESVLWALDFQLYPLISPAPLGSTSLFYANRDSQIVIQERGGSTVFRLEFIIEDN